MREKCQRCSKPASYHITDIEGGQVREHHFCDEHARQHLAPAEDAETPAGPWGGSSGSGKPSSKPAKESSPADRRACPYCQLTFSEFRNSGRLGCPHDYEVFRDELMPLLENIHDETRHTGKYPRRAPRSTERQTQMIELRKKLKQAIDVEDYELAARLRDQVRSLEQESGK
jgi:protein arginine kinase activator